MFFVVEFIGVFAVLFIASGMRGVYEAADGIHFEVIDVNRSHFKISPTKQECLDNLMRVTHDRRLSADVVSRYAELRGWQKDECVAYIHAAIEKYEKRHEFHKHFKRRKTK